MNSFSLRSFLYGLCHDYITASNSSPRTILSKSCAMLSFLETWIVTDRSRRLTSEHVFSTEANRWLEWRSSRCPTLLLLLYIPLTSTVQHKPYQSFGAGNIFFLILAHTLYKMWITQEPNKLELWNKLHLEEKKTESTEHVSNIQYLYLLNKYIKCNVWRLAVWYDPLGVERSIRLSVPLEKIRGEFMDIRILKGKA